MVSLEKDFSLLLHVFTGKETPKEDKNENMKTRMKKEEEQGTERGNQLAKSPAVDLTITVLSPQFQ